LLLELRKYLVISTEPLKNYYQRILLKELFPIYPIILLKSLE